MKLSISYFYQIRYFSSNQVPLSVARVDPKWFHQGKGSHYVYQDDHDVYNGLRLEDFVPNKYASPPCNQCKRSKLSIESCNYLRSYRQQLNQIDFEKLMCNLSDLERAIKGTDTTIKEVEFVLIVYEALDNPCSERLPIVDWFKSHNYDLKEWFKNG